MPSSWQLQTSPDGGSMHTSTAARGGWGDYLDALARADGRRLGSIVNFETFVQDDGERFPLHECRIDKVDPSEPAAKPAKPPPESKAEDPISHGMNGARGTRELLQSSSVTGATQGMLPNGNVSNGNVTEIAICLQPEDVP